VLQKYVSLEMVKAKEASAVEACLNDDTQISSTLVLHG